MALITTGCAFMDGGSSDLKNAQNDVMDNVTSLCQPGKNTTQGEMRAKLTESILRYNTAWIAADVQNMKKYPTTGAIMGTVATTCQEASELMDNMSKQINKYNLGV